MERARMEILSSDQYASIKIRQCCASVRLWITRQICSCGWWLLVFFEASGAFLINTPIRTYGFR
jgi:hypothetical protein